MPRMKVASNFQQARITKLLDDLAYPSAISNLRLSQLLGRSRSHSLKKFEVLTNNLHSLARNPAVTRQTEKTASGDQVLIYLCSHAQRTGLSKYKMSEYLRLGHTLEEVRARAAKSMTNIAVIAITRHLRTGR